MKKKNNKIKVSIIIRTKGHSGDKVDARGNVNIQGGSIVTTVGNSGSSAFTIRNESSASSPRIFNDLFEVDGIAGGTYSMGQLREMLDEILDQNLGKSLEEFGL